MTDAHEYYGYCAMCPTLHLRNDHCKNWVPQLDEPVEPSVASEYSKSGERCPECDSTDRRSHNLISHGALVPCDDPWHSKSGDAPATPKQTAEKFLNHLSAHAEKSGWVKQSPANASGYASYDEMRQAEGDAPAGTTPDAHEIAMKYFPQVLVQPIAQGTEWSGIVNSVSMGQDLNEAARRACIDAINEWSAARPSSAPPDGWISVEERLPEDGVSANVYVPQWDDLYLRNQVAWIDYDETPPVWINNGEALSGVTHWRPLPSPPAGQGGGNPDVH